MASRVRYQVTKAQQGVTSVLSHVPGVTLRGFVGPKTIDLDPLAIWRYLASYDAFPTSKIDVERPESETVEWLRRQLETLGPSDIYYLSLGGYALAAWAVIEGGEDWLPSLWQRLDSPELVVFNQDVDAMCGFVEEEYHYECHLVRKGDRQWEHFTSCGDAPGSGE